MKIILEVDDALGKAIIQTSTAKELIQCKDCKYWLPHSQFGFDEDNEEYHDYCERLVPEDDYYAFIRNADDFCSRAKRKDNRRCGICKHFLGGGDFGTCCDQTYELKYRDSKVCEKYSERKEE